MTPHEDTPRTGMIGIGTAIILYTLLIAVSVYLLTGTALIFALLIVGGLAAKSVLHYFRSRIE